jgi:hydroxymethylglutaryl-CoA lyase
MDQVEIVEVGPRDGLQNIPTFVPTETKVELIRRLVAAGFKRMELGSFVSPKAVPQMIDMEQVVASVGPLPGVRGMALVPNSKGARRAIDAGIADLIFVISMSDAHNMSNVRRPTAASIEDLRTLLEDVDPEGRLRIRVGLATCFHCPFEGILDEDAVIETIRRIVSLRDGLDLAISDTTGMALPTHVKSLSRRCLSEFGPSASFGYHGHDTAGFGVANVLAAHEAGITSFDASVAGLGGCPFAPGATGNVASEDLVYLFSRMGIETGIDLDRLLEAGELAAGLPGALTASHARAIPRERLFAASARSPVAVA